MKRGKLYSYSIMPLDVAHIDEICNDIKEQYESGIASCALFKMTLVPEGNPPSDKATLLCQKYMLFKEKLASMGLSCGILVQASVGHGWLLGEMFPFQTHVNFCDGVATRVCCPCDTGFQEYIYSAMKTIASCQPDCIMVDDDFRTIWFKGEGCACPLHMEMFNKRANTSLDREQLWKIVNEKGEKSKEYTDIYIETQKESLIHTAKIMRAGIDAIDPSLPASYCCCGNNAEFAYEIASVLAGEGNPITVRINNGNYTPAGARFFSRAFHRASTQIAKLKGKVDILLAETDTCPQNRYSTGAMSLHTHYTGSILEGTNGAKHWITRLITYEPESGRAYRRVLAKNFGFYERLAELQPTLRWRGCRIFVPSTTDFTYGRVKEEWDGWSYCVLERLGLPMYFSSEMGGVTCLEGDVDSRFSDDDILKLLSHPVILASDTAKNLCERGFSKYLGVTVGPWSGKTPYRELLSNGATLPIQQKTMGIYPISNDVMVESYVCNSNDDTNFERLFPAVTVYKNELGGTVAVFCGSPVAEFRLDTAFSFLAYSRKQQLIKMVSEMGELPVYYPNDEEVYFRCADMVDGRMFCAVFNIGLDPIDELEVCCEFEAKRFYMLMPNGEEKELSFIKDGDKYKLGIPCNILDPVVLFIEK